MLDGGAAFSSEQFVRMLRRDEFFVLLSAAFCTVGLLALLVALLGRRVNALLAWFGLFAFCYGARKWIQLPSTVLVMSHAVWVERFRDASRYLVPIPAFFYFKEAGTLKHGGRYIPPAAVVVFGTLFLITMITGPHYVVFLVDNVVVLLIVSAVAVESLLRPRREPDFVLFRRGLLTFAGLVLVGNISEMLGYDWSVEWIGFLVFTGVLGYVAARRTLQREQSFAELEKELEIATRIQMKILPPPFAGTGRLRIASRYLPMTSVAGDFYDYLPGDGEKMGLLIADVSGHGVPAAMIASMVKLAASSQRLHAERPALLLDGMNGALCGNTQGQFVTAAYLSLDPERGSMRYAAAAHPPMLLVRGGIVSEVVENGLMLAAFPFAHYAEIEQELRPGDRMVLYTDGIVEANSSTEEEFGQERLQALLRETAGAPAEETANRIVAAVQQWAHVQEDDLTVLVCDYQRTT